MAKPTPERIRPGTLQAYARWLNGSMGRAKYARLDRLAGQAGRRFAYRVQRTWGVEWRGATGRLHQVRSPAQVPPEMLLWGIGLVCVAWGADIYLRKARDRRSPKMRRLYRAWRRVLREGLAEIEREVRSHRAEWKHRQWARWVRRCQRDPRYNWRTNRIDRKRRRPKRRARSFGIKALPKLRPFRKQPRSFAKRTAKQSR